MRTLHVSTDFIFDGEDGPYDECDSQSDKLLWRIKLAAENSSAVFLRMVYSSNCSVYGVVDNMSRSNIVLWAKSALESGKELTVVNDQFRTPTLAEDLAHGCILIAQKGAKGIYNISGEELMCNRFGEKVAQYYELDDSKIKPISSSTLNQRAKRPPKTGFILEKAKKDLGYTPSSFEEGISIMDVQIAAGQIESK